MARTLRTPRSAHSAAVHSQIETPPRNPRRLRRSLGAGILGVAIGAAGCVVPPPPPPVEPCPTAAPRWSEPATWPEGIVPANGSDVTIPDDQTVALDTSTANLGSLTIHGTLVACRQDLALTSNWIMVHGALEAGTEALPFTHNLTITLTATDTAETIMGMGTRGLLVMGGRLDLHGAAPSVTFARIDAHVAAGSNVLQLAQATDWNVGDEVVVTHTDWYGAGQSERHTIAAINGATVTLALPLATGRWGRLQHVTSAGMSLTADASVTPTVQPTPMVLDERAEVANLTRRIRIQGADDTAWQTQGFGAHVMIMDLTSTVHVAGVEFRRSGQRGILGRYPIHWHRLSYDTVTNLAIGDASGHYVRSSTFNGSANRCITLHATNGVMVQDNVCYDIRGHGIFTEDAVERRNVIERNLVAYVRNPINGTALKVHESNGAPNGASSAYWISNPDNTVRDNVATDAQGFGFWLAFPQNPVGASANVAIRPDRTLFGVFSGNVTHSNQRQGVMLDFAETDSLGNTFPHQYVSTTDGADPLWPFPNVRRFNMHGVTTFKNGLGGLWDRVSEADFTEIVSADNEERFFAGAGSGGVIARSLAIGSSLNNATPRPHATMVPVAFASYHSAFDMRDNVVVNFPLVPGSRSGAFDTWDYYIRPVDKGHARNPGNVLVNSDPGYRHPRPSPNYALAGALWDPHGTFGPAGNYNVYNEPFLTHGASCQPILPAGSNGTSCDGNYYGVDSFVLDQGNDRWAGLFPINTTRYANDGTVAGTWNIGDGSVLSSFGNMRHVAVRESGRYLIDFPGRPVPGDVGVTIENALTTDDDVVLGFRFSGADPAAVFSTTYYNYHSGGYENAPPSATKHEYTAVADLASVTASAGETYWQDVANNVVWVKVLGGVTQGWNDVDHAEFSDERLYRAFNLRIH